MIREKLVLYNDYSSINKSCFSCHNFTHTIEECPKLHFVPNVEKIVKSYVFPKNNSRKAFVRLRERSKNSLIYQPSIRKIPSKKLSSLTPNTVLEEEDENYSNDSVSVTEEPSSPNKVNSEFKSISFFDPHQQVGFKKISTLPEEPYFGDNENGQLSKGAIISSSTLNNNNNNRDALESIKIISQNKIENPDVSIKKENSEKTMIKSKTINTVKNRHLDSGTNYSSAITTNVIKEVQIDKVHNFLKYFPNANIENILLRRPKILAAEREIQKKFIKNQYIVFKNYTFYMNGILEKFFREFKAKKNKRRDALKIKISKNFGKKEIKGSKENKKESLSISTLKSPLQRKTFFESAEKRSCSKIVNFADVISTLVEKNRRKHENKREGL